MTGGNAENKSDRSGLDNWTECFEVVYPRPLMEPFRNQASLIPVNGTIIFPLDSKNPLASDDIGGHIWLDQLPSSILDECIAFF